MTTVTRIHARRPTDTLAARLIILRHELDWSQRKAAHETGVPYGVWQGMESGRETRGLDRHVIAIAERTEYDRDWLMWGGNLWTPESPSPGGSQVTRGYDAYPLELARAA